MRLVCISDTHSCKGLAVPDGDLLIHAGDLTMLGEERKIAAAAFWLDNLPHRHKIVIAGNHDWLFQREPGLARAYMEPYLTYLEDSGCEIEGLKFWGSPWQHLSSPSKSATIFQKGIVADDRTLSTCFATFTSDVGLFAALIKNTRAQKGAGWPGPPDDFRPMVGARVGSHRCPILRQVGTILGLPQAHSDGF